MTRVPARIDRYRRHPFPQRCQALDPTVGHRYAIEQGRTKDLSPPHEVVLQLGYDRDLVPAVKMAFLSTKPLKEGPGGTHAYRHMAKAAQQRAVVGAAEGIRHISRCYTGLGLINLGLWHGDGLGDSVENEPKSLLTRAPGVNWPSLIAPSPRTVIMAFRKEM